MKAWTNRDEALLRQLASEGHGYKAIASVLERSPAAVALHARKLGVSVPRADPTRVRLLRQLLKRHGSLNAMQMGALLGTGRQSAYYSIRWLRARNEIRIASWTRNGSGPATPSYALGNEPDARRPRAQTSAERTRRYIDRMREDRPADLIARHKRNNLRQSTFVPRRDAAAAWF